MKHARWAVSLTGETGGIPPTNRKIGLSPPLIWPKNVDFVIFMQFLTILPKLSLPQVDPIWETLMGTQWIRLIDIQNALRLF